MPEDLKAKAAEAMSKLGGGAVEKAESWSEATKLRNDGAAKAENGNTEVLGKGGGAMGSLAEAAKSAMEGGLVLPEDLDARLKEKAARFEELHKQPPAHSFAPPPAPKGSLSDAAAGKAVGHTTRPAPSATSKSRPTLEQVVEKWVVENLNLRSFPALAEAHPVDVVISRLPSLIDAIKESGYGQ